MVKPVSSPRPAPPAPRTPDPQPAPANSARRPGPQDNAPAQGIDRDLALDLGQMALDLIGIVDPTPVSDGANALISLGRGNLLDAAISGVSILPGIGDVAKLGKLGRYAETMAKVADRVAGNPAAKEALEGAVGKLATALDRLPQGLVDRLPQAMRDSLDRIKDAVARFDRAPMRLAGAEAGRAPLAAERARRGLPAADLPANDSTVAMLRMRGQDYFGVNSGVQSPRTDIRLDRVNAQTRTHAEADVVQQALNDTARKRGGQAEMWVDRDLCRACGENGGMRSLARNLGVDELIVHTPSGTRRFAPTK